MISKGLEDKLIAKERNILAAQKRRDFPAVEAALAHGFHEIGGSGQLYLSEHCGLFLRPHARAGGLHP